MKVDLKKLAAGLQYDQWVELVARRHLIDAAASIKEQREAEPVHDDRDEELTELEALVEQAGYAYCQGSYDDTDVPQMIRKLAKEYLQEPAWKTFLGNELNRAAAALANAEVDDLVKELREQWNCVVHVKRRKLVTGTVVYLHIKKGPGRGMASGYSNAAAVTEICKGRFGNSRMTSGRYGIGAGGFDITVALRA